MSAKRTSFVGRDEELSQIAAWLNEGVPITIIGAAGIGKSRLASEAASRWSGESYAVDLSHETDAEGCAVRVARALELPSNAGLRDVGRALAERDRPLLVLDDADPIVEPLAGVVAQWLDDAPELRVITTSRERLRLRSERALELGPLSLVGGAASEASTLFRERVAQVAPRAQLDEEDLETWCEWLEGIPLAIELAAARAPLLGKVEGQRRLDVLRGGFRDARSRHSTLARAIEWSWGLLAEAERCTLAEASAFSDSFHVEATTEVLSRPPDGRSALEVVRSLAEKSFMRVEPDGRLRLFDAVREFASEAGPEEYRSALARLDDYLASQSQRDGAGLDALREDVMAAADRIVRGESSLGVNASAWVLVGAARFLASEGPASRLEKLMSVGLERLGEAHLDLTTRLRIALASGLRMQGRLEEAERVVSDTLVFEPKLLDEVRTQLLIEIALARHGQRDLEGAAELYARALESAPSRRDEGRLHANLGAIAHDRGDLDTAEVSYRKALVALGVTENKRLIGVVRSNMALLFQERGDLVLAQETFEQALRELGLAGEQYLGAIHRSNLGELHLELDDPSEAIKQHDEALVHLRGIGDQRSTVLCLCRRAAANAINGAVRAAGADLEEASSRAFGFDELLGCVVQLHQAFIPLGRALGTDDEGERVKRIQDCRSMIATVENHDGVDWRLSDDARAARRILETHLGRLSASRSAPPEEAIVVGIESRFFRVPGGDWQDLRRQTAARRILEHLVAQKDGQGASMEDLQAAAWPGERIRKDAATNRVHVALSKLRAKGLKPFLKRDEDGYRLASAVPIHRLAATSPPDTV